MLNDACTFNLLQEDETNDAEGQRSMSIQDLPLLLQWQRPNESPSVNEVDLR